MSNTTEISTDHIIRALRVYVTDLNDSRSPFSKGPKYLHDLSSWIACAATRLESLSGDKSEPETPVNAGR